MGCGHRLSDLIISSPTKMWHGQALPAGVAGTEWEKGLPQGLVRVCSCEHLLGGKGLAAHTCSATQLDMQFLGLLCCKTAWCSLLPAGQCVDRATCLHCSASAGVQLLYWASPTTPLNFPDWSWRQDIATSTREPVGEVPVFPWQRGLAESLKLLKPCVSRHEHFSRLSCLVDGCRDSLLYLTEMGATEQLRSQAWWFLAGSKEYSGIPDLCPCRGLRVYLLLRALCRQAYSQQQGS